ncbi:keratinocyte-associated protein 2 [Chiloscyllium punctatum]|uniref:keratinocyte-associated protein 2-like n=1 Tax=Chiloscyllium plagiosum TaxID=36176 RepID=UPI001CB85A1B|nr:keratinocyte-associated protein 2-like [Chiloscyllium plagiosum]
MSKRTAVSFVLSSLLSILIYSALGIYKENLVNDKGMILCSGFVTSYLFIFSLTAVNNLENMMFGMGFEASFFPEVLSCFGLALYTSYQVHPVSCSSCLVFCLVQLYFINQLSRNIYHMSESSNVTKEIKGRKRT